MTDSTMQTTIETITPAIAEKYLSMNRRNRTVRQSRVNEYARAMQQGCWNVDGNSVKFDKEGRMIDGQHRLRAVIRSGVPIQTLVVRGLDPGVFRSLDRAIPRTTGQILSMDGIENATVVASAALILAIDRAGELGGGWNLRLEPQELIRIVEETPELIDAVSLTANGARRLGVSSGVVAWAYHKFNKIDAGLCQSFFSSLFSGENMGRGNPIYALRERLVGRGGQRGRLERRDLAILIVRAWNAFVEGKSLDKVQLLRSDAAGAQFPVIRKPRRRTA